MVQFQQFYKLLLIEIILSLKKKLFSGSAIRLTHLFLEIIVGFLLMPYLVSQLTEKWYGLWLLVGSITGFFTLLTLGLSSAVQRYLSYEISAKKYDDYRITISSSLLVFGIAACLCMLIAFGVSISTAHFIKDETLKTTFSALILLVGGNFAIKFISTPFVAALTAEFKFVLVSSIEITGFIIKTILTVYFIEQDYGVISVGLALIIGEALANVFIAIMAFYKIKEFRINILNIEKNKLLELYKFGLNTFIGTLGTMLRFPIGNIIISVFVGLSSVTIYSIPVRLLNYADAFIVTSLGVLQPYFTKLYAEENYVELRNKFDLANSISFGLAGLLAGGLFTFGAAFIGLWVGEYEETRLLTLILPFTLLFVISQYPSTMLLYTLGKHKYLAVKNLLEAVVNVVLALIFIKFLGIPGVALAVVLPMLVIRVFFIPKYVCKQLGTSYILYFIKMIKNYSFIIGYSIIWLFFEIPISSWFHIIAWGGGYSLIYIFIYSFFILEKSHRLAMRAFILRGLKRFS